MSADRTLEALFRLRVDRAGAAAAGAAVRGVGEDIETLRRDTFALGPTAQAAVRSVEQGFVGARGEIRAAFDDLEAFRRELIETGNLTVSPEIRVSKPGAVPGLREAGKGAGDLGSLVTAAGGLVGGDTGAVLGMIGQLGDVSQYASQAGEAVKLLASGLGTSTAGLAGAAGAAGLAVAGVALAIDHFNRGIEEQRQILAGAIDGAMTYFEIIETGTTASIENALEALRIQKQVQENQVRFLQQELAKAIGQENAAFGDFGAAALTLVSSLPSEEFAAKLQTVQANLAETTGTIDSYERALASSEVAANDAAAAEKELAAARTAAALAGAADAREDFEQNGRWRELSSTALREESRALEDRANGLRVEIQALLDSGVATEETTARIEALRVELQDAVGDQARLTATFEALAAAREREQAALETQIGAIQAAGDAQADLARLTRSASIEQIARQLDLNTALQAAKAGEIAQLEALNNTSAAAQTALEAARNELAALRGEAETLATAAPSAAARELDTLNAAIRDLRVNTAAEAQTLATTLAGDLAQITDDLSRAIGEANADFAEADTAARLKNQRDIDRFNRDTERAEADHQRRLQDIQRDARLAIQNAAANLDARGVLAAEQNRDQQLSAEDDRYTAEQEKRAEDYAALLQSQADEARARQRDYERKLADLNTQAQREQAALQTKYNAELNALYAKLSQEQSLLQTQYTSAQAALQAALQGEMALRTAGHAQMLSDTSTFVTGLISEGARLLTSFAQMSQALPAYATVNNSRAMTVNNHITGQNAGQILGVLVEQLRNFWGGQA